MASPDLVIAASFWEDYRNEITAVVTVLIAFLLAEIVDRALQRRGKVLAGADLSPVTQTRLRLVRRLIFATIIVIGIGLALVQFDAISRAATGVLASSAVLGLVVGFAARATLANVVAGILLAITQPIRIGDFVTFEGTDGTVEDVRLTYTYLRAGDGRRIVIPNERLAQSTIENHTIVDPRVHVEVSVWIPPHADATRALEALNGIEDVDAQIAESERDGVRLVAGTWAPSADERGATAARVRAACLERLRNEGLSSKPDG